MVAHRPALTPERAQALLREFWGIEGSLDPLPADRDQNFRVRAGEDEDGAPTHLLKVFQSDENPGFLEAQDRAMERLAEARLPWSFPRVRPTLGRERAGRVESEGATHLVRLVTWVPGIPLAGAGPRLPGLLREVGALLGAVDRVLAELDHPALEWEFEWDLRRGVEVVERHGVHVAEPARRRLLDHFLELQEARVDHVADRLPLQAIHGDGNDHNILLRTGLPDREGDVAPRLSGLLDFGDMIHSWRVGEPAVGAAYALLDTEDPVAALSAVAAGYNRELPLEEDELRVLFPLVTLRLCVSVIHSARRAGERPHDPYLRISEAPAWRALETLATLDPDAVEDAVRRELAP